MQRLRQHQRKKACNGALVSGGKGRHTSSVATRVNESSFQLQRDTIVPNSFLPGQGNEGGANVVTRERQRHTHRAAGLHGQQPVTSSASLNDFFEKADCPGPLPVNSKGTSFTVEFRLLREGCPRVRRVPQATARHVKCTSSTERFFRVRRVSQPTVRRVKGASISPIQ